jgi:hypothetical protein
MGRPCVGLFGRLPALPHRATRPLPYGSASDERELRHSLIGFQTFGRDNEVFRRSMRTLTSEPADPIAQSSTVLASVPLLEVNKMPPRGVKGAKNKRMYEKIKKSAKGRGRSTKTAKRIAAATVNKHRSKAKRSRAAKKR